MESSQYWCHINLKEPDPYLALTSVFLVSSVNTVHWQPWHKVRAKKRCMKLLWEQSRIFSLASKISLPIKVEPLKLRRWIWNSWKREKEQLFLEIISKISWHLVSFVDPIDHQPTVLIRISPYALWSADPTCQIHHTNTAFLTVKPGGARSSTCHNQGWLGPVGLYHQTIEPKVRNVL